MPIETIDGRRGLFAHEEFASASSPTAILFEHARMSPTRDLSKHQRVNDILLGPLERLALEWLAVHTPNCVSPDVYTAIGVIGALWILISYALSRFAPEFLWLASLGFVINWLGDSMDGTLARYRQIERPLYGFFVDHTSDAFNEAMMMLGLGLTPYIRFDLACLALSVYLLLSVLVFVHTCVSGEFKISYCKVGPTEVRIAAILLNTAMYFGGMRVIAVSFGPIGRLTFSPYDLVLVAIVLILFTSFVVTAILESIRLAKANESSRDDRGAR
jgi:phosphatidylglycerophosphate synthase